MNNFLFFKNPEKGFSTDQLKGIHTNLQNLGYSKNFSEFYSELAEACGEKYEDYALTDKKVAPLLSKKIFELLEIYAQPDIRSKIFALSGSQRRMQAQMHISTIYFTKQSVLDFLEETHPELVPFVEDMQGMSFVPGFGVPVTEKAETLTYQPKEEKVLGLTLSTATKTILKDGQRKNVTEVQKASLFVVSEGKEYEVPICRPQATTGAIDSIFEEQEGVLLSEKKVSLSIKEYMDEYSDLFAQSKKNAFRLP